MASGMLWRFSLCPISLKYRYWKESRAGTGEKAQKETHQFFLLGLDRCSGGEIDQGATMGEHLAHDAETKYTDYVNPYCSQHFYG